LANHFEDNPVGEYDGNEIGEGEFTIWLYGPDAGKLAEEVQQVLASHPVPAGSFLYACHGPVEDEDAQVEKIPI
jgi:hypothetical protein